MGDRLTWLYVSAAIATIIGSIITALGYFKISPPGVVAMTALLPFFIGGLLALSIFNAIFMLWFRRQARIAAKTIGELTTSAKLAEKTGIENRNRCLLAAKERDDLKEEACKLAGIERKYADAEQEIKRLKAIETEFRFLADSDVNNRDARIHFLDSGMRAEEPYLGSESYVDLSIPLMNLSIFQAEVLRVEDKLTYENRPFRDVPQFNHTAKLIIKHAESVPLRLRQYLSDEMASVIKESPEPIILKTGKFCAVLAMQDEHGTRHEIRREFPNAEFKVETGAMELHGLAELARIQRTTFREMYESKSNRIDELEEALGQAGHILGDELEESSSDHARNYERIGDALQVIRQAKGR